MDEEIAYRSWFEKVRNAKTIAAEVDVDLPGVETGFQDGLQS